MSKRSNSESEMGVEPAVKLQKGEDPQNDLTPDCSICLEPIGGSEPSNLYLCGHCFHCSCIGKWKQATCPMCRRKLEHALNAQQLLVMQQFQLSNSNILLIGAAGTGKSLLLGKMVAELEKSKASFLLCATTGAAADVIRGETLHRALGILVDLSDPPTFERTRDKIISSHAADWKQLEVLILDEVSMLDGVLLDWLNDIAKLVRQNDAPFGGIRLVLCGDPLQLGPVKAKKLFFQAGCFDELFGKGVGGKPAPGQVVALTQIMRQRNAEWLGLLQRLRVGRHTAGDMMTLSKRAVDACDVDKTSLLRLFCRNQRVDEINTMRVAALVRAGAESQVLKCGIESAAPSAATQHLLKPPVTICVGAKVMHTRNIPPLINGSQGRVISLSPLVVDFERVGEQAVIIVKDRRMVRFRGRRYEATVSYTPLILAYALTVHKAQGATIEQGSCDLSNAFDAGQVYTALSRFASLDGLCIEGFNPRKIKVNRDCLEFVERYL